MEGIAIIGPRLVELAGLQEFCRQTLDVVSRKSQWAGPPGSAARVLADELAKLPAPPSGRALLPMVVDVVQTYLVTAAQHLGGLSALFRSGEVVVSAASLARSVIESSARTMWVLGSLRQHTATQLANGVLARVYLEEDLSARQANVAARRMGNAGNPQVAELQAEVRDGMKQLRADAATYFDADTTMAVFVGKRSMNGQQCPSPSEAVAWMFELLHAESASTLSAREALGMYDFLSSHSHPTLYPLRQVRRWTYDDGHARADFVHELEHLERLSRAAITSFYNALSFAMSFFGLDLSPYERLTARIHAVDPAAFNMPPAAGR